MSQVPSLVNRPSLLVYKTVKILIHDAPTDSNLAEYLQIYRKNNVQAVIRACEASYSPAPLESAGIQVSELSFTDGEGPPSDVIDKFLVIAEKVFAANPEKKDKSAMSGSASSSNLAGLGSSDPPMAAIAIHCVAGLGRAPVLACIALIEIGGLNGLDAVDLVRKRRRGAINAKQLKFLEAYKPKRKTAKDAKGEGCIIA